MSKHRLPYTRENFENAAKECKSIAEMCRFFGIKDRGSNYQTMRKYIVEFDVDISHFTGEGWLKGMDYTEKASRYKLEDVLQDGVSYRSLYLKKRLIENGLKEDICEVCGLGSEWNGKPITLELHHINGNHYDNRIENLQVLCPNCHSQTENYRNKKKNKKNTDKSEVFYFKRNSAKEYKCETCGKIFYSIKARRYCSRECYNNMLKQNNSHNSISKEELERTSEICMTMAELAEKFGVSRPTIRKFLDDYGLLEKFKEKYDYHAKQVVQCNEKWEIIKVWPSITDAETTLGITGVEKVCRHKQKSAGGFRWRYYE